MKYINLKKLSYRIAANESIRECDKIFSIYWQNIVLIAALIIIILFAGKYIIENKVLSADNMVSGEVSKKTSTINENLSDTDEGNSTLVKRAYLTFDDGPSKQTGEILDILAENDVKATFFIIGRDEEYYDMYRRIVDEGHTIGLHSYTHDYSKIYASKEDFINDVEELRNLLYDLPDPLILKRLRNFIFAIYTNFTPFFDEGVA